MDASSPVSSPHPGTSIQDEAGHIATVVGTASDGFSVRYADALLVLPADSLRQDGDRWLAALVFDKLAPGDRVVLQELDERLRVEKRSVETGRVRLTKRVETHEEAISMPLLREEVDIERVPIGTYVDEAPPVRTEDGVTVISVVEEVLVVEKRLLLREELRVTRRQTTTVEERVETLRSETIDVERSGAPEREPFSGSR